MYAATHVRLESGAGQRDMRPHCPAPLDDFDAVQFQPVPYVFLRVVRVDDEREELATRAAAFGAGADSRHFAVWQALIDSC